VIEEHEFYTDSDGVKYLRIRVRRKHVTSVFLYISRIFRLTYAYNLANNKVSFFHQTDLFS
jgi:hypothetical protein